MYKLLAIFLILGAISLSKQAGNSSPNKPEAPAVKDYPCNVVPDKKPWCACRSSLSPNIIDLSSLGIEEGSSSLTANIRPPKFVSNEVDGWRIAWTPCKDFDLFTNITLNPDEMACKGVGFARYTETSGKICHGYGSHGSSAKFYSNGYGPKTKDETFYIEFLFKSKDGQVRNARIWLKCTLDPKKSYLKYLGDKQGVEVAEFFSKCCCSNQQCSSKVDPPGKRYHLGSGAIAGIAVSCIIAVIAPIVIIVYVWYKKRPKYPVPVDGQEHDERLPIFNRA